MAKRSAKLLEVAGLATGYGKKQVVADVSVDVAAGEVVALIGHNGAGKSTLLKAIFGLLPTWSGSVSLDGTKLQSPTPRELLKLGVSYVPQGNRIFTDLSVRENLEMGAAAVLDRRRFRQQTERIFRLFPVLEPRLRQRAGTLSGGEKQMLALASALLLSPRLLLLDEPSLGLAPPLVSDALVLIRQVAENDNTAVLIVEQKVRAVLRIAQRVLVLRNGRVSYSGSPNSLKDTAKLRQAYL